VRKAMPSRTHKALHLRNTFFINPLPGPLRTYEWNVRRATKVPGRFS
jgi:hypothetical protein